MPPKQQKKKMEKLTEAIKKCQITSAATEETQQPSASTSEEVQSYKLIFANDIKPDFLIRFPKIKSYVQAIFVHNPVNFEDHAREIIKIGIKLYHPSQGRNFTKLICGSFEDHGFLVQYLQSMDVPFHTYGYPDKKKMKVVIRGLPDDIDLNELKEALKSHSIPIIRIHKMRTKVVKNPKKKFPTLVLAVVPYGFAGLKLLKLKKVSHHDVTIEPPFHKPKQCHRCQKWGHTQRYCQGIIKCVKCAGNHMSNKCTRDTKVEPPKCANCNGPHTANYHKCSYCPASKQYKNTQLAKKRKRNKSPIPKCFMRNP